MTNVSSAYNQWAEIYDSNKNRTRDLEAISLRTLLAGRQFQRCLEIGCGTGKNTEWLLTIAELITAVDLSEGMLSKAREKIKSLQVDFIQADITQDWQFANGQYDLATFSLVLEHIENLDSIFAKLKAVMQPNGYVYVGELHPFKQYTGTKARFDTAEGQEVVTCFNHHVGEFYAAAKAVGFELVELKEWFDEDNREIPRILSLLFCVS
ncbi:MAG: class I SAM-dependent methyltransferase [Flavihumibacter sp.]|jgi:ubiquinone/menaquinone biosynthesis C-methylase UbiE|nr:class I SAM-dependent methyltransferase [Flavihumibacter sp.]